MEPVELREDFGPPPDSGPALEQGQVHVWAVSLSGNVEPFEGLLSLEEVDRVERFRFAEHRRRYTISRGALRTILGRYIGTPPQELRFGAGRRGKPFLEEHEDLQFNLSHSGHLAMVALGTFPIGVDLEKIRRLESCRDIARRHFSECEFAELDELPEDEQLAGFYRCWTRKEAYIKALGEGLSMPLDSFDVSIGPEARLLALRNRDDRVEDWSMHDVSPTHDYAAAIAARRPGCGVRCFRFGG